MFDIKTITRKIGEHEIILETGKIARQAAGAVVVRYAGNAMLVTATVSPDPSDNDFFPLTVHFQEKFYSVGRIPGGFFRREAKPSDNATLMARQIDRPIRPLFDKNFKNEVQIIVTLLNSDLEYTTEGMGILGTVAALAISPIPIIEYAGGVKIIWHPKSGYKINPSLIDIKNSHLDLLVAGTREGVCMVEGGANEVSEEIVLEALRLAQEAILEEIAMIEEFTKLINPTKMEIIIPKSHFSDDQKREIKDLAYPKIQAVSNDNNKHQRSLNLKKIYTEIFEKFEITKEHIAYKELKNIIDNFEVAIIREQILIKKVRTDGRQLTEIRPIDIELDIFNGLHGSALFTRGQTQSLGVTTLGMPKDEMLIDSVYSNQVYTKRFFLHYNFPPYSVGEVKRLGGLSRREIGHGHLAERALIPILPDYEKFPYTIRFVSEITESNGSSSMASVCSGSLSMMAAGVPLKASVAGIAMGLVWDKESNDYTVLSDIQGLEDHHGDMDFKVAGSINGITAIQMDLKTAGLPESIMKVALSQAKEGRKHILELMDNIISKSRNEVADIAPKLHKISINPELIGTVIGSGGRVIKKIMSDYDIEINIEDNGNTIISGQDSIKIVAAIDLIRKLTDGFREDEEIIGEITRIEAFGVFIEILPGTQALLHSSKMKDDKKTMKIGDKITVFFKNVDDKKRYNVYQVNKDVEAPRKERKEYNKDRNYKNYRSEKSDYSNKNNQEVKPKDNEPINNKTTTSKNDHKGHSPDSGF